MADGLIQVPVDSTGKKVDTTELAVGANNVERQRINVSSPTDANGHAEVKNTQPASTDYGLVTRRAPKGLTLATFNFNVAGVDQALAPAAVGKVNKIWKLWLVVDGDTAISLKDGAAVRIGPINYAQGGVIEWQLDEEPWFITSANTPFNVLTSLGVNCGGIIGYTQE